MDDDEIRLPYAVAVEELRDVIRLTLVAEFLALMPADTEWLGGRPVALVGDALEIAIDNLARNIAQRLVAREFTR